MANPNLTAVPFQNVTNLTATYNIFITTNKGIANLFSAYQVKRGTTFSEFYKHPLLQGGVGKNTGREYEGRLGVFMSTTDLNILEFSHSYNFGQGKTVENMIKLKTFEPGMEILKKFFFMFMQEQMSGIKIRKSFISTQSNLIKRLSKYKENQLAEENPREYGYTMRENELDEALQIEGKEKDLLAYMEKNSIGQQVYIAYGVGQDLKDWAGPFQATLGKIVYDNNGMEETLTYEMFTDHIARQFEDSTLLEMDKGFKPVDFIRPTIPVVGFDYTSNRSATNFDVGRTILPDSFTPSIHDTIVKLISYYLYSLGIKNHLIVLPNLDLLLAKQVAEAVSLEDWHKLFDQEEDFSLLNDTVMTEYYSKGFDSFGTFTNALSEDYFAKYSLKVAKDLSKKIKSLYIELFSFGTIADSRTWIWERFKGLTLQKRINLLLTVFTRIGMKVNKSEMVSSDNADSALVNFIDPSGAPARTPVNWALYQGAGLTGHPQNIVTATDPFSPDSSPLRADAIFNLELPLEHLPSGKIANQDGSYYMAPIMDIVNSILQSGGNAAYSPTYFWENDVKIVNKLKEKFGSGTFEGYVQQFAENKKAVGGQTDIGTKGIGTTLPANALTNAFIPPPPPAYEDNYFIFGDADLIKLFVYGEYSHVAVNNKVSRLESTRIWEGIPFEFNTYLGKGRYFFMDPFWNRLKDDLQLCTQDDTEFNWGVEVIPAELEGTNEQKYMSNLYKSYFYEMRSLLKGKYAVMGHFNEYDLNPEERRFEFATKLPDEFKLLTQTADPKMKDAISDLFDLGPIIFVANDKNANVLSYNFDNDQFIFSQFFGTLKEIYYNTHLRYSNTLAYPLKGEPSTDITRSALYSMLENLGNRSGRHGQLFKKVFPDLDLGVDIGRLAADMADIMILESTGSTRYSPVGRKSATLSVLQLFLSLFKHQYRGIITTLPMFSVANMGVLTRPGLVLFRSTGRVNTYSESPITTMDFFTGLYKILGFKHSITNTDAKSEFIVYKDIEGMLG